MHSALGIIRENIQTQGFCGLDEATYAQINHSPTDLSFADHLPFLEPEERRLLSRIQGRTYANMIGLFARFVGVKIGELSREQDLGDQDTEAVVVSPREELKHEELFLRIEESIAEGMPPGYCLFPQPGDVAEFVLARSAWAVLALSSHIESLAHGHYRQSIAPDARLSRLYKDVYFSLWMESTHASLDGLEWLREDARIDPKARDKAVNDFIILLQGIDALLLFQADWDVDYFAAICPRTIAARDIELLRKRVLSVYRWQYIASGLAHPRFADLLCNMINADQAARIDADLAPMLASSHQGIGFNASSWADALTKPNFA